VNRIQCESPKITHRRLRCFGIFGATTNFLVRGNGASMSRGKLLFRERDLSRAWRAALKAGVRLQRVEIDRDGKIIMVPGPQEQDGSEQQGGNEWDSV
jgi:hypothetical protein